MRTSTLWSGHAFDAVVVVVAIAAEVEIVAIDVAGPRWVLMPAVLLYTLPLLLRRRWPLAAPVFVISVQVVSTFTDAPGGSVRPGVWWPTCSRSGSPVR